ncbi:DedA family protein [Actinomadura rudentiformis]|uniref:DedA family protein n=1 Tax=Actinomadura rudentiformis TaxID=359158 RepID=A0A6H9YH49_9ACTN|nr:DedA family protein [Actinomadura rudentiformis]KAB2344371.1 DedA family protein [Actinomadura rudentiformis]
MPKDLFGLPLWAALVVAILIIFVRGQAYYWIGRGLGAKLYTSRLGRRVGEERLRKVEALVARRGALAVFAAHWIAGLRHAIPICAGGMRMPLPRYLLATALGSILWTSMIMLGGYALVWGWLEIAARSPLIAAAVGIAALALLVAYLAYRRRRAEHPAETPDKDGAHV